MSNFEEYLPDPGEHAKKCWEWYQHMAANLGPNKSLPPHLIKEKADHIIQTIDRLVEESKNK